MTHDDLYPCTNCGRDNLYPGPCASCEHFIHPPAFDVAAVAAELKPLAVELGRHIILPRHSRVVCYDCRKPCNGTCPASRGEPAGDV
jgi:hypothetical protein